MIRSSEFPYHGQGKNEKLISMCKFVGSDTYLSGSGGKAYVDVKAFYNANIKLQWHNYDHPVYKQSFEGFVANMSIADLLFNVGPKAKEVILSGGYKEEKQYASDYTEVEQVTVEQSQNLAISAA